MSFGRGLVPATATPLAMSGFNSLNVEAAPVEEVGYWRRQYRRYGYPVPYAYYPVPRMATMRLRPRTPTIRPQYWLLIRLPPRMAGNIHPGMPTTATIRPRMATRATIRPRMVLTLHGPCVCEPCGSSQC